MHPAKYDFDGVARDDGEPAAGHRGLHTNGFGATGLLFLQGGGLFEVPEGLPRLPSAHEVLPEQVGRLDQELLIITFVRVTVRHLQVITGLLLVSGRSVRSSEGNMRGNASTIISGLLENPERGQIGTDGPCNITLLQ